AFRDAKKGVEAIKSHRHSSNNSIVFETEEQIDVFDWRALVEDNAEFGEPGILNLWRCRGGWPYLDAHDPLIEGVNPCGEIPLHDREACCLSEVYPALFDANDDRYKIFSTVARYT